MNASKELFPLDILYSEIPQWLANRRKLPTDWMKRLRELRVKIDKSFNAFPSSFVALFETQEDGTIEYSTVKAIRDKLAETSERGYFGGLAGEAGEWDKIVKAYEKGNLYLGEAGQRVLKNVDYELPFMKKRIETLDKRVLELTRKMTECENNAASASARFGKECVELGIVGKDLKTEIEAIGDRIFEALRKGMDTLRSETTKKAIEFYRVLSVQLHESGDDAFPICRQIFEDRIPSIDPRFLPDASKMQFLSKPTAETEADVSNGADIDWDFEIEETTHEERAFSSVEWAEDEISWDIEIEKPKIENESEPQPTLLNVSDEAVVNSTQQANLETLPSEILRFVFDVPFRNAFLNELYELHAFLTVISKADVSMAVSQTVAEVLYKYDREEVVRFLTHLKEVLEHFDGERCQRYLMLRTSTTFAERMLQDLTKKSKKEEEWRRLAQATEREKRSVQNEMSQLSIKTGYLAKQTKELKTLIEESISPLFDGRRINIMGKIHSAIASL